jgi:tetratricopeptide (TPR) repeat protein
MRKLGTTTGGGAGAAMRSTIERIEELRQAGLAEVRGNELESAIRFYDEALSLCEDDETRELVTINKADALIALERNGAEVQELARVIMRRRNPRHVCLAAYALQYKHRLESDFKRALFYGQLALRAAEESNDLAYKRAVLVDLGNIYEMDSQIERAIESFDQALDLLDDADEIHNLSRGYTLENLGYCQLLIGETEKGLATIHQALRYLSDPLGLVEAYVDLCYGYLENGDFEQARSYGERALACATDSRHIRNAHYLLGEVAFTSGDNERADHHFDQLARFYPDFKNLKSVLFAIDLRGMVNLKL